MDVSPLNFDRPVPLFPLPNCVLFPGVVQPLHIFEPRYRQMVEEMLGEGEVGAGGGSSAPVMAMALLKPGWEKHYYGRAEIFETVCVGRVVAHERVEDGKYNLLLHGVSRARVLGERKQNLYRVAMLEPVLDVMPAVGAASGHEMLQRKVLRELFEKTALKELTVAPTLAALFEEGVEGSSVGGAGGPVPLGRVIDALAFTLVQDVGIKQAMLEERDALKRGEMLLQELVGLAARLGVEAGKGGKDGEENVGWPPHLSVN